MEGRSLCMYKIGIVILNYITWQETNNCIESIQKSIGDSNVQIYVVDNASPNFEKSEFLCSGENIHFIANKENTGYAAGNNVGIAKALEDDCEYILISNNDILFEKDSILGMQQYLETHSEYGIVAPCVLDKKKEIQHCHFIKRVEYKDIWATQTVIRYLYKKAIDKVCGNCDLYRSECDIFAACGCCFMMSAECAKKVTPLDEKTFLYEEENILGIRMEQKGIKTRYIPYSKVIHNHDQTTKLVKPFALICWACSEVYYLSEYLCVKKWKIALLYGYRTLIFLIHGIKNAEYRKQWKDYKEKTKRFIWEFCINAQEM